MAQPVAPAFDFKAYLRRADPSQVYEIVELRRHGFSRTVRAQKLALFMSAAARQDRFKRGKFGGHEYLVLNFNPWVIIPPLEGDAVPPTPQVSHVPVCIRWDTFADRV